MAQYIYSPIVVRTAYNEGHEITPEPEFIDRVCKSYELRVCPIRKCIEFIGGKQPGRGSRRARGKRYLRKECGCSGIAVKMTYLVYYKRNSEYADFFDLI